MSDLDAWVTPEDARLTLRSMVLDAVVATCDVTGLRASRASETMINTVVDKLLTQAEHTAALLIRAIGDSPASSAAPSEATAPAEPALED